MKKLDERAVPSTVRIRVDAGRAVTREAPFAAPGDPLPRRELGLFAVPGGGRVYVEDRGDPEQQIMVLGWNAEGTEILTILRGLPEAYRETLTMRLVEQMSGQEIAAATGLTHGSVRVNLHRGMKLLREELRKEGYA